MLGVFFVANVREEFFCHFSPALASKTEKFPFLQQKGDGNKFIHRKIEKLSCEREEAVHAD